MKKIYASQMFFGIMLICFILVEYESFGIIFATILFGISTVYNMFAEFQTIEPKED